ncbi:MAG: flippase-like domain-containing protein [Thermoleophilia bacterium]|nr:flippase-like domain-containing protein [Thermoleophilia bacterium]
MGGRRWVRWAGLAAGVAIIAALAWTVVDAWDVVTSFDWQVSAGWLALAVALALGSLLLSALAYEAILGGLHHPTPPVVATVSAWARSLLGRYVPGNVLMVVGRAVMAEAHGVPKRITVAATTYEQVIALVAASLLAVVALLEVGSGSSVGPAAWLVLAVPLAALLLHPRVFGPASAWALGRVHRPPLGALLPFGRVILMVGWYLVTAAMLGLSVWAFMRGVGGPEIGDPVGVASGFLLAFVVSMLVFIVPSGLGVRDAMLALVLSWQVPAGVAVALSVGSRLFLIAVELVFVALAAGAGRRRGQA